MHGQRLLRKSSKLSICATQFRLSLLHAPKSCIVPSQTRTKLFIQNTRSVPVSSPGHGEFLPWIDSMTLLWGGGLGVLSLPHLIYSLTISSADHEEVRISNYEANMFTCCPAQAVQPKCDQIVLSTDSTQRTSYCVSNYQLQTAPSETLGR